MAKPRYSPFLINPPKRAKSRKRAKNPLVELLSLNPRHKGGKRKMARKRRRKSRGTVGSLKKRKRRTRLLFVLGSGLGAKRRRRRKARTPKRKRRKTVRASYNPPRRKRRKRGRRKRARSRRGLKGLLMITAPSTRRARKRGLRRRLRNPIVRGEIGRWGTNILAGVGGWIVTSYVAEGLFGKFVNLGQPLWNFASRLASSLVGTWLFGFVTPQAERQRLRTWFFVGGALNSVLFPLGQLAAQKRIPALPGLIEPLSLPSPTQPPAKVEAAAQQPLVQPLPTPPSVVNTAMAAMGTGVHVSRYDTY